MTTLSQARRKWKETIRQYQKIRPTRTAILGDGHGTAEANLIVPGRSDYVFARDTMADTNFFQVLNNGAVQPAINLPVVIGLPVPGEKIEEPAIIGIHYAGLGSISSDSIPRVGPHHQQHEFRGGDDVIIEPRQFTPGLIYPTSPASMRVKINTLIYYWDTWERLSATISEDLTSYTPSSGYVAFVLIALDPEAGQIVYRSNILSSGSQDVILGIFNTTVPAPAGNEIPLGYVRLLSTTTAIDWTETADNIGDARIWVNPPMLNILDRLRQLEGATGNPPSLATMGVAQYSVDDDITGTGVANRVAYWSGATTLTNSSVFTFDGIGIGMGVVPSSTNFLHVVQPVVTSGSPSAFVLAGGVHTTLTASTEAIDVNFNLARTVQFATGALTTQRAAVFQAPTYAFVGASTITTAATVAISDKPAAGANATITTPLALWVQGGRTLMGAAPLNTAIISVLEIATPITIITTFGIPLWVTSTITAHANADFMRGAQITPTFAKSTFTGLHTSGLFVSSGTPTGDGTIADHATARLIEETFATANIGLLIGTHPGGSTNYALYINSANANYMGGGLVMGAPTGGNKGAGTINVATNIYLNDSAYGNPDYALEYWLSGKVEKYANNSGADGYKRMSLDEIESYIREYMRLPRITDEPSGIFDRADIALEKIEELFTFVIEINKRIGELDAKSRQD